MYAHAKKMPWIRIKVASFQKDRIDMLLSITAAMVISSARAALMREDTMNDIDNICLIIAICVGLVFIIAFISISVWLTKLFMGK